MLNPPAERVIGPDEELLMLAEDDEHPVHQPYHAGPLRLADIESRLRRSGASRGALLVLGCNEKLFPIIKEFDAYVGEGSTLTLVNIAPLGGAGARDRRGLRPLRTRDDSPPGR